MSKKSRTGNPLAAVAYLRVSTVDQALGLDAQRVEIEGWAARAGVVVVSWHVDRGVSGGSTIADRPGMLEAFGALEAHGAGLLVVAKRDRLARDVVVAATAETMARSAGALVVSADGTGAGDGPEAALMRTLLDAFAQYERAIIRARVKKTLGVKKSRGELVGAVPFGQRLGADGVRLEVEASEQETIARARALRSEGWSLREVAASLALEGRKSRNGRTFDAKQISRLLAA
jgi:DNA invertase Pin-like site-specific DNA recombinase